MAPNPHLSSCELQRPSGRRIRPVRPLCCTGLLGLVLLGPMIGCGTQAGETFFTTGTATAQTLFDLWLTAFANGLADFLVPLDQAGQNPPADGGQNGGNGGGNLGDLTGDAANGQTLFTANSCANCHCADASGGCALNAPNITGVSVDQVNDRLRGSISHPGGKFDLTDQEIVDIQAFLASLGG